jgi:hypothetical protein
MGGEFFFSFSKTSKESEVSVDPFESVSSEYKQPLPLKLVSPLKAMATQLPLGLLLPVMKDCLVENMTEDSFISSEVPIKHVLGACEADGDNTLEECDWFQLHFDETVECAFFLELYLLLKNLQK